MFFRTAHVTQASDTRIGPAETVSASIVSGQIPRSLGGVQVTFSGWAAPLLSAGPNQIRAMVPFEIVPTMLNVC